MSFEKSVFKKFVYGFQQLIQRCRNTLVPDLRAGCGRVAASAEGFENDLHICLTDGARRDDRLLFLGIKHKGGFNAGNVQQLIRSLGGENTVGGLLQGSNGQVVCN